MVTTARRAGHYGLLRGGHGVRMSYPWLQRTERASQGGARRSRRYWPWQSVLGPVVGCSDWWSGARTSGLMFGPVVECSDQWSGARTCGLVLGLVVGCSDRWWLHHGGGVASAACVLGYGVRGTSRGLRVQGLRDGHVQRECAVLVCLEAEDGLGLRAHGMECHGRSSKV